MAELADELEDAADEYDEYSCDLVGVDLVAVVGDADSHGEDLAGGDDEGQDVLFEQFHHGVYCDLS